MQAVLEQVVGFIKGNTFFHYHGLVLACLWFFAAPVGILLRKVSTLLHAMAFFLIDVTSVFFISGAIIRVYPYLGNFLEWNFIKQGHIAGGFFFLIFLILQHIGGVITLVKGISNPAHRKFGIVVSNLGRFVALGGMILAKQDNNLIIGAAVLTVVLLVASARKLVAPKQQQNKASAPQAERQRSPPRDIKRD